MQLTAIALLVAAVTAVSVQHGEHGDLKGYHQKPEKESCKHIDLIVDDELIEIAIENVDDLDVDMDEIIEVAIEVAVEEGASEVEVVVEEVVDEEGYRKTKAYVKAVKEPRHSEEEIAARLAFREAREAEEMQRREFRDDRRTWEEENRPSWDDFMPEDLEFNVLGAGESEDHRDWSKTEEAKAMDYDMHDLRE